MLHLPALVSNEKVKKIHTYVNKLVSAIFIYDHNFTTKLRRSCDILWSTYDFSKIISCEGERHVHSCIQAKLRKMDVAA